MIDVYKLLYEICGDERVFDLEFDLFEEETLDSYAFIELLTQLDENGIEIHPTRVDKSLFRTSGSIQSLVDSYSESCR